ncbi:MAG: AAA family ATPase [Proteocatella sp.]
MIYLKEFEFPSGDMEFDFIIEIKRKCYDSFYPFKILSKNSFEKIDFEPVTILYGGNGCGKTTALNVIAETLDIKRDSIYNKSNFYDEYIKMCSFEINCNIPLISRIITSDDVFDYMLNIRNINEGIDTKREDLFKEYLDAKYSEFKFRSLDDYDELRRVNTAKTKTQSQFVRKNLMNNIRGYSNGESGFLYFTEKIKENGLYILDEPENSLSIERQMELSEIIEEYTRFYNCQFIISTHSPFMLSIKGAKVYDLDERPVDVKRWTELKSIRKYYEFFKKHESEF